MSVCDRTDYYGVDHTLTYIWESATRSISNVVIDFLPNLILDKNKNGSKNRTLEDATDIKMALYKTKKSFPFNFKIDKKYPYKPL